MFALDGKTFNIKNLQVHFDRDFKSEDMSGMSSFAMLSEQGDKPASLQVTGLIAFKDINQLADLQSMSSDKDDNGDRKLYRIVNELANAFNIREAKFNGKFSATEHDKLMAWNVSFRLVEQRSVAEQKEQRQRAQTKPQQAENGQLQTALENADEATQ
ncbi:DNA-binding protein [Vibrio metschnikovii]|uniref:baseplate complex protein n=1 Tax=Vibrio metschnikovii TaxID=28172 RepID=UPI0013028161|nr:DNA-binding protein [Vibrio metschnikovii]